MEMLTTFFSIWTILCVIAIFLVALRKDSKYVAEDIESYFDTKYLYRKVIMFFLVGFILPFSIPYSINNIINNRK